MQQAAALLAPDLYRLAVAHPDWPWRIVGWVGGLPRPTFPEGPCDHDGRRGCVHCSPPWPDRNLGALTQQAVRRFWDVDRTVGPFPHRRKGLLRTGG